MATESATRFFFKHAGYSYNPATETRTQGRWRGARALATAERYAADRDWCFCWKMDEEADHSWCDRTDSHQHEVFGCVLRDDAGNVLASLWGIFDPDPTYSRVVEAELALEAMPEKEA